MTILHGTYNLIESIAFDSWYYVAYGIAWLLMIGYIPGMDFNLLGCALVLAVGTMAGIVFSLIAMKTKSVWNSAIVHAV